MMAAAAIAALDRQMSQHGEDVTVQRLTAVAGAQTVAAEVSCRAFVRGYKPEELVGGITQQDQKVILSPTEITAAGWTSGRPVAEDVRVPMPGNRIVVKGRARHVQAAGGFYMAGILVRIELQIRG